MNGRTSAGSKAASGVAPSSKLLRGHEKDKATPDNSGAPGPLAARAKNVTEDTLATALEEGKDALLGEKQLQLQRVFDRHDDMVRELHHMHKYQLMLAYDPRPAKSENSIDFNVWKAENQYDLLGKVSFEAGRRTRGTQIPVAPSFPSRPLPVTSQKSKTRSSKDKSKDKLNAEAIYEIISATIEKAHDRGRRTVHERTVDANTSKPKDPVSPSAATVLPKRAKSGGRTHGARAVLSAIDIDQSSQVTPLMIPAPPTRRTRARDDLPSIPIVMTQQAAIQRDRLPSDVAQESISVALGKRGSRHRMKLGEEPPPKKAKIISGIPLVEDHPDLEFSARPIKVVLQQKEVQDPPIVPFSNIKRVKLVVRKPPPSLSHHRQRPPPPNYGSSLANFLNSYKTIGDEETHDDKIARRVLVEARIRNQEADFRHQGRFIPGTDLLFGSDPNAVLYDPPKRTTRDVWDDIIDIVAVIRAKNSKKSVGQQIAGQIASKVQVYWDAQEIKKDRVKAQEEKKLKALAKATMKMVISEWKKALHHVREQERLKIEAEERRRGHQHLDAILDQSGQLLETQQGDLTRRARNRSESMDRWGDQEEAEEDEDDVYDGSDGSDGHEEDVDVATEDAEMESSTAFIEELVEESSDSDGEEEEEEEEEEGDMDEGTALLLGPAARPTTSTSKTLEEDVLDEVHDVDLTPLESSLQLPMSSTTEVDCTSSRALPSIRSPEDLSHRRGLSEESDDALILKISPEGDMDIVEEGQDRRRESISLSRAEMVDSENEVLEGGCLKRDIEEEEEEEELQERSIMSRRQEEEEEEGEKKEEEEEEEEKMVEDFVRPVEPAAINENELRIEEEGDQAQDEATEFPSDFRLPNYLQPFAVTRVDWNSEEKVQSPLLLRGVLRPYQHSGLEWLASLHTNNLNGILADEMGLGKTIQTIALLAYLACDRGIWGPHLIIVPTSVLLNWEMEFKKFLPGFKVLSYHGTTKRRKELRQGWNDKYHFNVCITSYTFASRDAHIFKRKPWYYMILDEAHMIKNFKSQRWNILLMFRSFRRLLLTGTPLQNNLTELWALLQFLMSGSNFANLKEFGDWFSNPLERAIETGNTLDDETLQRVTKLHTVLRPYLLRRLKRDVEKELPSKYEHLVLCPLSKRQRFLYDEFMSRAQTRDDLQSGVYHKIANILMQLRKVCNHPDLFEVRPVVTSFAMRQSAVAGFEIKELLIRKRWLEAENERVNLDLLGYQFINQQDEPLLTAVETRQLSASLEMPYIHDLPGEPPPKDTRTIVGYRRYRTYMQQIERMSYWKHVAYLNAIKCSRQPIYPSEMLSVVGRLYKPLVPLSAVDLHIDHVRPVHRAVLSYAERTDSMAEEINKFACVTPSVAALDLPQLALGAYQNQFSSLPLEFDQILHPVSVKLQIAFPDPSLLQYDCGKLQQLKRLLQEKKAGSHRVLIFTQMTRILDILEIFLNLSGYLYLRLDGATKIEDRQYITERFNADSRIFCFIASSRSGGVGINLTGADTVIFYDSDFNPQMDKQCEDRAHRIGQIRDVHIYRLVSQHTVEEAMLRKANQKRSLDDIVIQKGEFDWRTIFGDRGGGVLGANGAVTALTKALGEFEDIEDARAAAVAAREESAMEGADNDDFEGGENVVESRSRSRTAGNEGDLMPDAQTRVETEEPELEYEQDDEGGTIVDHMLAVVQREYNSYFKDWRI